MCHPFKSSCFLFSTWTAALPNFLYYSWVHLASSAWLAWKMWNSSGASEKAIVMKSCLQTFSFFLVILSWNKISNETLPKHYPFVLKPVIQLQLLIVCYFWFCSWNNGSSKVVSAKNIESAKKDRARSPAKVKLFLVFGKRSYNLIRAEHWNRWSEKSS